MRFANIFILCSGFPIVHNGKHRCAWQDSDTETDTDTDKDSDDSGDNEVLVECVDSSSKDAEARKELTRKRVIQEIICTEERFCSSLRCAHVSHEFAGQR